VAAILGFIAIWILKGNSTKVGTEEQRIDAGFQRIDIANERIERELRTEIRENSQSNRQEIAQNVTHFQQTLSAQIATLQNSQIDGFAQQLVKLTDTNEARLLALQKAVDERLVGFSQETHNGREESANTLKRFGDGLNQQLADVRATIENRLKDIETQNSTKLEEVRKTIDEGLAGFSLDARSGREEGANTLNRFGEGLNQQFSDVRTTIEARLKDIETQNSTKLEEMRKTVDEKLHATLENRLGESFKLVSERLEAVHKGLGEMQTLASGVGDLKRVLTNVKIRGTWGEVQLGALLEQILTPDQYAKNVATRPGSREVVEFAIRLPGKQDEGQLWLPIDSKFPIDDYDRIVAAQDIADVAAMEEASKALEVRIKNEGKTIREKYIEPPHTTDFGILFLPTEGLYSEVLRRPGLCDWLQRDCRVTVAGPTTLTALLNSLQMGFRTLAIEKRSSEVWQVLGAVKTEFGKFGEVLANAKKQLQTVAKSIDSAETRTRQMERKLKGVEALPGADAIRLLGSEIESDLEESSEP